MRRRKIVPMIRKKRNGHQLYLVNNDCEGSQQPGSQTLRRLVRNLDAHLEKAYRKLRMRLARDEQPEVDVARWKCLIRWFVQKQRETPYDTYACAR